MDAYRCIMTKRDLRTYDGRPIEPEVLLKILDAGRRTGSARNRQPWEFVAVTERALLEQLSRCGMFARHLAGAAAAVVILTEDARNAYDAGRCAQSMMLAAWSLGVASCPVTLQRDAGVRAALGIPGGPVLVPALTLGYPHPEGRGTLERAGLRLAARRGRKPLASLVHWNRYGARRAG
jgi:nitroreductase